jgi:hypothetical protein
MMNDVGSRAGNIRDNGSKLSNQTIEKGGFTDIGRSD